MIPIANPGFSTQPLEVNVEGWGERKKKENPVVLVSWLVGLQSSTFQLSSTSNEALHSFHLYLFPFLNVKSEDG
ncbi:hypothetical protein ACQP3L_36615, partial [Escherichia coli]